MNIKHEILELKLEFPLTIVTDIHCRGHGLKRLVKRGAKNIICLGDITDLFQKDDKINQNIIDYFIETKIPCLRGNHEEFLIKVNTLPEYCISYLRKLPRAFKIKDNLLLHNELNDLWIFREFIAPNDFNIIHLPGFARIIHGHYHRNEELSYGNQKLTRIGALKYGDYAILNEDNSIEYRKV